MKNKPFLFIVCLVSTINSSIAQTFGDYRTKQTGIWSDAANWQTYNGTSWVNASAYPVSSNGVVTILAGHAVTSTINLAVDQVIINSGGTLNITAGIFTLTDGGGTDLLCSGILSFSGGTMDGAGSMIVQSGAGFTWSGGFKLGNGITDINTGATFNMDGNPHFLGDAATINNNGTWNWTGGTFHYYNGSPAVNNYATFNIVTDADVIPSFGNTGTFNNASRGIINKFGSPDNETSFSGFATFTNSGIININSSKINIAVNAVFSKSIAIAFGAAMRFTGGTANIDAGTAISGAGDFNFEAGNFFVNAPITVSGATINFSGGVLRGPSSITMNQGTTFNWSGGFIGGSGSLTIRAGANFNTSGAGSQFNQLYLGDAKTINNFGTWTWSSGSFIYYAGLQKINNYGTFNISTDADISGAGSNNASFYNRSTGIINKIGSPADETSFSGIGSFINDGKINVISSKLNIALNNAVHNNVISADFGATFRQGGNVANFNKGSSFSGNGIISLEGGTFQFNAPASVSTNTVNLRGGFFTGDSIFTVNKGAVFNWISGTIGGSGLLNIDSGANFNLSGGDHYLSEVRTINNKGICTWTAGILYYLNGGNPSFTNSGTLNINTDSDISSNIFSVGSFINQSTGIINKTGLSTDETSFNGFANFINQGKVNIISGNLALNVAGAHSGSYTIAAGSQLRGNINMLFTGSTFTNNGTVTLNELNFSKTSLQTLTGTGSINTLTINNAGGVSLGGSHTVNNRLNLTKGKITCNSRNLTLGAAAQLFGGSAASYIVTNGTGGLQRRVPNDSSAVFFPVGPAASYMPFTLRLSKASVTDTFKVRVLPNLYASYDAAGNPAGSPYSNNVVNSTWIVSEKTKGGSNATLTAQWNGSNEATGFNRSISNCGTYAGNAWGLDSVKAASGNNPYTLTKTNTTAFSQFGIFNQLVSSLNTYAVLCRGNNGSVPYKAVGAFTAGNQFMAQLSDSAGSFAAPVNIGTVVSTVSGNILATIPASTMAATGYRIRVISNNPSLISADNGSDITIGNCGAIIPNQEITCAPPADLKALEVTQTSVNVSWSGLSGSGYEVQYKQAAAVSWNSLQALSANLSIDKLQPYTTYKVKVRARCVFGNSAFSAEQTFITTSAVLNAPMAKAFTNDVLVYPNPNNGQFTLAVQFKAVKTNYATIEIMNAAGQRIHVEKIPVSGYGFKKEIILPHSYPSGIYVAKIVAGNEILYSKILLRK